MELQIIQNKIFEIRGCRVIKKEDENKPRRPIGHLSYNNDNQRQTK
jgi:hypothetical protein